MSDEKIQLSCRFERSKLKQICEEVDAEAGAAPFEEVIPKVEAKSVAETQTPIFEDELCCPAPSPKAPELVVAKMPEVSKVEEQLTRENWPPPSGGEYAVVFVISFVSSAAVRVYRIWASKQFTETSMMDAAFYTCLFGVLGGLLTCVVLDILESIIKRPISPATLLVNAPKPITNTALGLWTAVKGTGYGIGCGIYGLYYAVTNQLIPSFCWSYQHKIYDWSDWSSKQDGDAAVGSRLATYLPHVSGLVFSIVTVTYDGWGIPLVSKLIIGWWGFYVLNILYFIGKNAQESKEAS